VVYDRANSSIALAKPGDIDWDAVFDGAGWFHITGITPAISASAAGLSAESMRKAREKGIRLSLDINPSASGPVMGDEARVRQVLLNLAGNAVKFTEDGEVVLRVSEVERPSGERRLLIEVVDTGIGIPADRLDAVFDSFTQADGSTNRR